MVDYGSATSTTLFVVMIGFISHYFARFWEAAGKFMLESRKRMLEKNCKYDLVLHDQ